MADPTPRTLVVAQAWIGDLVFSQMLYALLARQQPAARIDVVAPVWAEPLLRRMPEVDRHWTLDVKHGRLRLGRRLKLARELRGQYQQAIVIPRSVKAALLPYWAGIPKRIGFGTTTRGGLLTDAQARPAGIQAQMAQLASSSVAEDEVPWPHLEVTSQAAENMLSRLGVDPKAPRVGLVPGAAYGPAKQWGVEAYAELAALLANQGQQVIVLGTAQERAMGEAIAAAAPQQTVNGCGRTTLDEVIDLMAGLGGVVGNDSGLMHVAAAVGTPVVGIYGSTSPDTHPPLTTQRVICSARAICSPCHRRVCPYEVHACMTAIPPQQVCDAVLSLQR